MRSLSLPWPLRALAAARGGGGSGAADPAPSRWAYRFQRLMLTPLFRRLLKLGLPAALCLGAAAGYLGDQDRRDGLRMWAADLRASIENRPEFRVDLMAIEGASRDVSEDIREILQIDFPVSSFDLDLDAMRRAVIGLDPVEAATLRVRPGGVLQIRVSERVPALVWRHARGVELLDAAGAPVRQIPSRAMRPDLPLIAGEGADANVPEALALVAAAQPIAPRLRGLVRVGERRWDVVLDRGQRILLPEEEPVRALERAIAMDQAQDLLARDVSVVDVRLATRPTLRLNAAAIEAMQVIRKVELGGQVPE